jgi:lipopolysaccharide transport system ATP-binding protein
MDRPLWSDNARGTSGSGKGRILAVGVFDAAGRPTQRASIGEDLRFRVLFRSQSDEPLARERRAQEQARPGRDGGGLVHAAGGTASPGAERGSVLRAQLCPMLEAGDYSFSVSLGQATAVGAGSVVDETPWLGPLKVAWDYASHVPPFYGMVGSAMRGDASWCRATGAHP